MTHRGYRAMSCGVPSAPGTIRRVVAPANRDQVGEGGAGEPPSAPVVLALVGPTATGKTALALSLAERLPLEVVSADSRMVYRWMDVGTAKPSWEERNRVPHH